MNGCLDALDFSEFKGGATGQRDASSEEAFAGAVGERAVSVVDRLQVHGLPQGTSFDVQLGEEFVQVRG